MAEQNQSLLEFFSGGCNLNRPTPDLIKDAGFEIQTLKAEYVSGLPKIAGYVYRGTACKS